MSEYSLTKDKYFRLKVKLNNGTITQGERDDMAELQRTIVELKNKRIRSVTSDNPEHRN